MGTVLIFNFWMQHLDFKRTVSKWYGEAKRIIPYVRKNILRLCAVREKSTWAAFIVDPERPRNAAGRQTGPAEARSGQDAAVSSVASGIETLQTAHWLFLGCLHHRQLLIAPHRTNQTHWKNLHWVKCGLVWYMFSAVMLCLEELVESGGVAGVLRHFCLPVPDHVVFHNLYDSTAAAINGHWSGRISADGRLLWN